MGPLFRFDERGPGRFWLEGISWAPYSALMSGGPGDSGSKVSRGLLFFPTTGGLRRSPGDFWWDPYF